MLDINISQEVKDYLRMRGSKTFTIYTKLMTSCWSSMLDIFVRLREPVVPEKYNKYEVDGITVYIYKEAVFKGDSIQIEIPKTGSDMAGKDFEVFGLEI